MPPLNHHLPPSVRNMFDRIAGRYDLLNRVISLRLDARWRHQAIQSLIGDGERLILDLGTGTGDLAFTAASRLKGRGRVVGLDFSFEMLKLGQMKRATARGGDRAAFVLGSALAPPLKDAVFDGVMSAFVLRNVSDLRLFFSQAFRVLKPGGRLVTLDMFPPAHGLFSLLYSVYFYRLVPRIGGFLARDREAYQYLSDSVRRFQPPEAISALIEQSGFAGVRIKKFLHGAVCLHIGEKPAAGDRS